MKRCMTVILLAAILLTGCSRETAGRETGVTEFQNSASDQGMDVMIPSSDGSLRVDIPGFTLETDPDRKLMQSAELQLETDRFDTARTEIKEQIRGVGGYIKEERISRDEEALRKADFEIYVPVEQTESFLLRMETTGSVVKSNLKTTDVTQCVIDLESRIQALETERENVLALLEQTESVEERLSIESQLAEINRKLTSATEEKELQKSLVPYSTVYLQLQETPATPTVWQRISRGFGKCLWGVGRFFEGAFVLLVSGFPLWGSIALICILVKLVLWLQEKRRNKKDRT